MSPDPHPLSSLLGQAMDDDLYRCVHCGLCLSVCPTYGETGLETESPRGRIALMKGLQEGRIGASKRVVSHWDLCLGCRACEVACPSGVPYGRLIEGVREEVLRQGAVSWRYRLVAALFLRGLLPQAFNAAKVGFAFEVVSAMGCAQPAQEEQCAQANAGRPGKTGGPAS